MSDWGEWEAQGGGVVSSVGQRLNVLMYPGDRAQKALVPGKDTGIEQPNASL